MTISSADVIAGHLEQDHGVQVAVPYGNIKKRHDALPHESHRADDYDPAGMSPVETNRWRRFKLPGSPGPATQ